ncbi:MAG TPA: ABC transporter ATP-binding protein [Candidatus Binatia bacterium]|nr:ABC transporter ATP-binding protein [Candidatus Binatia bacterium]
MPLAIEALGLRRSFGRVRAVDGIDLAVPQGAVYGFLGPNGSGKTTTIRLLLGLLRPDGGSVRLLGRPLRREPTLFARLGAVVERPAFYPGASARDNLRIFAAVAGRRGRDVDGRIDEVLDLVGLADAAGRKVRSFSTGMQQRLAIGLAILHRPELLVLDEPTAGLDPVGVVDVRRLIARLAGGGVTVFLSSHVLSEVEQLCDRAAVVRRGQIVAEGPLETIRGGGGSLVLRFADEDERGRAADALAEAGFEPEVPPDPLAILVPIPESDHRIGGDHAAVDPGRGGPETGEPIGRAVVRRLAEAGCYPVEVRVERRSLEHAFLDLVEEPGAGEGVP